MSWPMPGSPDPSGASTPGMQAGGSQEPYGPVTTPAGWPPWEEAPLPRESPSLQPAPVAPEYLPERRPPREQRARHEQRHEQRAPVEQRARGTAPGRSPLRATVHARALVWSGLSALGALAVLVGLVAPGGEAAFFYATRYWAVFAGVCALVQLAPVARPVLGWPAERAWTVGAAGVAGLVVFWLLIVLPVISSNESFVVTAGVAAAAAGSWLAPGRRL
jgi:hypothetical protein